MSSQTRQRFPLYKAQCRVKLDNAFRCTRLSVESDSSALYAVQGSVSSQTRQRFPLYKVQCRGHIDTLLNERICGREVYNHVLGIRYVATGAKGHSCLQNVQIGTEGDKLSLLFSGHGWGGLKRTEHKAEHSLASMPSWLRSTETILPCAVSYGDESGAASLSDRNRRIISRFFIYFSRYVRIFPCVVGRAS